MTEEREPQAVPSDAELVDGIRAMVAQAARDRRNAVARQGIRDRMGRASHRERPERQPDGSWKYRPSQA